MDKLILVNFCFALLTSQVVQCVSSATEQESPGPALPRFYDDTFRQELPTLPAFSEPSKPPNNSYTADFKELQPLLNSDAENESISNSTKSINKESVSTGKQQFPQSKNAIGRLQNQGLLSSFRKYQTEKQLPKHDPNLEEQYKQNYTRPELLQKKFYQNDKDLKKELDRQQNSFLHTNRSQKNSSEWVQQLPSISKSQLPPKKDESKVIGDKNGDKFDNATDFHASERNDKFYSYGKKNGLVKSDSGKVHSQLSASDKLQQLISQQQTNKNTHSRFPSSPVNSKLNKTFTNNDYDVEEEDNREDKETDDYIIDEKSQEYNPADAGNADSYNKNEKNYDANSDEDFAKKNVIQGSKEYDSNNQTGRLNKEDKTVYETESDKADSEIDDYDLEDIIGDIVLNNQVKKDYYNNQTGRSNGKDKTKSDNAENKNNPEDNVDFTNPSSVDDDSIDETNAAVDSSDSDETEEISVNADTAVVLHDKAENSSLLSGSHSKNAQATERRIIKSSVEDWLNQESKVDDDSEDYRDNEGSKAGSEEYKDDDDDDIDLGEHDKDDDDDDDEEYDVTKWSQHGDDDDADWDDDTEDDFDESKNPIDELATKKRQPTAPTRMVLFYTWMVVAVLLIIVGVSTYQSRCRGFKFFGTKASNPKDDRKRLMEHEFV